MDKGIPLALVCALLFQTGTAIWWAASTSARIEQSEARLARIETAEISQRILSDRVMRLELVIERMDKTLNKIESSIRP